MSVSTETTKRRDIALVSTMKHTIMIFFALVLGGVLLGCSTTVDSSRQLAVTYSKPSSESLKKIKMERVSLAKEQLNKLAPLPRSTTRFESRWFVEEKPDTMRDGPWNTRLYIFDSLDTNQCVRLELINHASSDVEYAWLNEKLLFVSVWWGRIAWTDFVLNTETMRFAYIEDGLYVEMLRSQQESDSKSMQIPGWNAP